MPIRDIQVTNTASGKKEVLKTGTPGKLTMYSCGPTVYGLIHIGNLRAALVADLFFRYFRKAGYEVTYVRNYTDVDDRIIEKANKEKTTSEEVARKYTQEVEKDYAVAGLLEPTRKTRATEHIPEMIEMIEQMISKGHAYVVQGEVLFSIQSFQEYGKLSHREKEDMVAGVRVEVGAHKRDPLDFALWKPAKSGEPSWPSPWGPGRPGWHIECSAMATKWLGPSIDVHHGAVDLIFPHHENEIAQTEAATGVKPFVRYWLHNAFLTLSKEKMSKSLGNVFLAREFLTQFSGELARYVLLSVHYRSEIDFDEHSIDNALTSLHRIYEAKQSALALTRQKSMLPHAPAEAAWGSFVMDCENTRKAMDDQFANDFGTPGALAALYTLIREFNRITADPAVRSTTSAVLGGQALISVIEQDLGAVLGVGLLSPDKALADLQRIRATRPGAGGAARPAAEEIERKIQERAEARKAKDFAKADAIRQELLSRGVEIKDSAGKTSWEYK